MVRLIQKIILTVLAGVIGTLLLVVGLFFSSPIKGLDLIAVIVGVICVLCVVFLWFSPMQMISNLQNKFKDS